MKLTTLVFSGASSKAPIYIGIYRCLLEYSIINPQLDGIQEIITCSIGLVFTIYLLFQVTIEVQELMTLRLNFLQLLDIENVNIHNLLFDNGLFNNSKVVSLVKSVIHQKCGKSDITLKELYDIKPIKITVKCVNITQGYVEYINHENHPNLSILTLLQMTTSIPIFFKPVEYNQCLYVDGGLMGGFPIEQTSDNYLGFNIESKSQPIQLLDEIPLLNFMYSLLKVKNVNYEDYSDEHIINYQSNIHFTNFDISNIQKKELIQHGYEITKQHIETYKITNDLFNEHPEDSNPTETV
tara:strand:+ start:449 stop:1336 length:888 start_codon:yes stop_codon:yes gene_type:complete